MKLSELLEETKTRAVASPDVVDAYVSSVVDSVREFTPALVRELVNHAYRNGYMQGHRAGAEDMATAFKNAGAK